MTDKRVCTWSVEKTEEVDGESIPMLLPCGNKAFVEFSEIIKMKNTLPKRIRYPRCRKHASKKTIGYAEDHGYAIEYLEEEET